MAKRKEIRQIPCLFVKGSTELGQLTGVMDKRIHEKWRNAGLPYLVMDGAFLYEVKNVEKFLRQHYAPQEIKLKA